MLANGKIEREMSAFRGEIVRRERIKREIMCVKSFKGTCNFFCSFSAWIMSIPTGQWFQDLPLIWGSRNLQNRKNITIIIIIISFVIIIHKETLQGKKKNYIEPYRLLSGCK